MMTISVFLYNPQWSNYKVIKDINGELNQK